VSDREYPLPQCPHYFLGPPTLVRSRGSSVSIATGYGLDDQKPGVQVPVGETFFLSPHRDLFWGPPNLVRCGYEGFFPGG
jgi:hypothetical protein